MKSIDCGDILRSCKEFILTCSADELLDVSKMWYNDDDAVFNILLDKDI